MLTYIAIDDTDNDTSKGTGWLLEDLCNRLCKHELAYSGFISRHQLFVHPEVPYTSHNSAMCCPLEHKVDLKEIISFVQNFLEEESAPGSDPGFCAISAHKISCRPELSQYSRQAKSEVLNKDMAYSLADKMGAHLSEHGGSGDGVIGALAGIGLRMDGQDGRIRGWYHLGMQGREISVGQLLKLEGIEEVRSCNGQRLEPEVQVTLQGKIKSVLMGHKRVLPVKKSTENKYRMLNKEEIRSF